MAEKGRIGAKEPYRDTLARQSAEQGMLVKQDAIIDALKAMAAKLDADAGVTDTDYAATITDALAKLELKT